jgi:hypothetical protein
MQRALDRTCFAVVSIGEQAVINQQALAGRLYKLIPKTVVTSTGMNARIVKVDP